MRIEVTIIIITIIIMRMIIKIMITIIMVIMIIITWNISHPKNLKSNLHVQPPLLSDHLLKSTGYPKHQNFSSQTLPIGTSHKVTPPVSNSNHYLGLTV